MTTRGIRRKKSYLVDAKIAVCGQKSVGKSGRVHKQILFFLNSLAFAKVHLMNMMRRKVFLL